MSHTNHTYTHTQVPDSLVLHKYIFYADKIKQVFVIAFNKLFMLNLLSSLVLHEYKLSICTTEIKEKLEHSDEVIARKNEGLS